MPKPRHKPARSPSRAILTSPVAGRVLEHLARYRFLTADQLVRLGASSNKGTVHDWLRELLTAGMINRLEWRLGPSAGRLPNEHYLKPKGARQVGDALGIEVAVPHPKTGSASAAAYAAHRIMTVDALIAADGWAAATGQAVPELRTYFRQGETALALGDKAAVADAIVTTTSTAGVRRAYVVEVYRDYGGHPAHPRKQLAPYAVAGQFAAFDDQLGVAGQPARILVVCDTPALRDRLARTLPAQADTPPADARVWGRFLFKAADELDGFGEGWRGINGELVNLAA